MSAREASNGRGRLLVIAAPSGAGKTTLVRALMELRPDIEFSISYTTRPRRRTETHGHDYFFVDKAEFDAMIARDAFLEHACVFDNWYGTGRAEVERKLAAGTTVLLEIDWQGARQVRARAAEALTIFVMPPSLHELERRLRDRASDPEETIARRLRDALGDMSHWAEFDYVVINDEIDEAARQLAAIVAGEGDANRTDAPVQRTAVERILAGAAG